MRSLLKVRPTTLTKQQIKTALHTHQQQLDGYQTEESVTVPTPPIRKLKPTFKNVFLADQESEPAMGSKV